MVRSKGLIGIAAAAAICSACKPAETPQRLSPPVAKVRATVVTIRTTLQPQNKSFTHALVIANGRARSGDEVDAWRLFDLRKNEVAFIDDVAKTVRRVPLATLLAERRTALAQPLPVPLPRAEVVATGAKRVLQGIEATERVIRLGAYQRSLWMAEHPALPDGLFAMTQASTPPASTLAGVARAVDEALVTMQGFPLVDHAELPYGNKKMVVEHSVIRIEQKDVPESWLSIPAGYSILESSASSSRGAAAGSAEPPRLK